MSFLNSMVIRNSIHDSVAWSFSNNGMFSVKSFRNNLENFPVEFHSCSSFLWKNLCPPKVEIFAWQLRKGRIMVRDVLVRFSMGNDLSGNCLLCNNGDETIDHLFVHCSWSWKVWNYGMSWWEVMCCPNKSLIDWMDCWIGLSPYTKSLRAWNILFFAVIWTIWEVGNNLIFRGQEAVIEKAVDEVKFRLVWWFKCFGKGNKDLVPKFKL
ncbi:hypothetical protein LWI29_015555 [Acer saccharum]|uniref:Reverse transcriptase zinc-binding domain-containing protein n=1 Tax=Acer saccharum TaxID=4024 RepID=A0AA39VRV0_ACESA|nr:hypothetical protein LWI29_015555 [Acer saccharum]